MTEDSIYNLKDFLYSKYARDIILDFGDNNHTHVDNPCTINQLTKRLGHRYGLLLGIMLRLGKNNINNLNSIILSLFKKFKRLNLILPDLEEYTRDDIDQYEKQLNELIPSVITEYKKGNQIEFNFLSDRLFLNKFNNCILFVTPNLL